MAFIDNLAFEMVTLVLAAATIAYTAFMGLVEYRRRGPDGVRSSLRGSAGPLGFVGGVALSIGLWNDLAWPLPGAYNILFGDIYMLFGIVLVAFVTTVLLNTKLQYFGMFSLVAGAATFEYGYQAYHLNMTKEPLEMFGLYGAFGLAAMLAFPAALIVDRMLAGAFAVPSSTAVETPSEVRVGSRLGQRATQPITTGVGSSSAADATTTTVAPTARGTFHLPSYATIVVLVFFVFSVAAAIAAMFFVGNTVPSHLASPP